MLNNPEHRDIKSLKIQFPVKVSSRGKQHLPISSYLMDVKYLVKFYWILLVFMIGPQVNCLEYLFFKTLRPRIIAHIENNVATLHWHISQKFTHAVIEFWEYGDPQGVISSRPCRESPACRERKKKSNVLSGKFDISSLDICCFRVTWFYNDQQVERSSCMGKENQVNPICRRYCKFSLTSLREPDSRNSGKNIKMEKFSDTGPETTPFFVGRYFALVLISIIAPLLLIFVIILFVLPNNRKMKDLQPKLLIEDLQFNEEYVRNLRKNKNLILEHLNIDELLPRLCEVEVLTETERHIIKHERSERQKREIFYNILSHKNGTTYWKFITVLQNSDQRFLTTLLEAPGLLKLCVKENIDSELLRGEKEKKEYVKASRNFQKHLQGGGNSPFIQLLEEMNVKIRWIYHGSVVYMLQFPSTKELEEFKKSYDSKIKPVIEKEVSVPAPWFQKKSYMFSEISDEEYESCKQELNRLDGIAFMGWQEKLQNCRESLIEDMCPDGIVDRLWANSLLNNKQRQKIKSKSTEYEQNEMIIDKILNMDSWHFAVFVAFLDETGQEHLASNLGDASDASGRTDLLPMSQSHKSTLRETSYILIDNLQADSWFISLMKQKKILSEYDYQRVLTMTNPLDTAREIIHILKSKSDSCFCKFGQALCETNQCHLSDKLKTCSHPKKQYRSSGRNIDTLKKGPKENTLIYQKICSLLLKKETLIWIPFIFMIIFGIIIYDQLRNVKDN